MNSSWLSYVPQHVAADLLAHPDESPIGREQRLSVVALFADVSGFTAISEALGKAGKLGTEQLTTILNSYFDPMIALVQSYGGIVGKFGGDAMTVLFPYTQATRAITARRAIQCALEMQATMGRYEAIPTPAGTFGLAMKAGLAMGSVLCVNVGDPAVRLEYIIAGEVLDQCADAEHHANKGEVVVEDEMLIDADDVALSERRSGFSCVAQLRQTVQPQPLPTPEPVAAEGLDVFAAFIHPTIAQRLRNDQSGFINEHRKVTVLFVSFSGFDYDYDPQVSAKLQAYLSAVIRVVQRYDGYINKVDMGDKGSKYIVLFGAPVAHEDDEERALHCALELRAFVMAEPDDLFNVDLRLRVGINTGFAYCGQVGSAARQEYTVMGDTVNLAARLMQAAQPAQIIVSSATQRPIAERFAWEKLSPISVKGKSEPIEIYQAQAARSVATVVGSEAAYMLPLVGRIDELQQIRLALTQAQRGRGRVVGVVAEAGMGKSRLAAEASQWASGHGFVSYSGACQSFGATTSYLVWRDVWRSFFGLNSGTSVNAQLEQLTTQLTALDAHLLLRLPLLGVVLNLPIPENDLTQSLDAQLRVDLLKPLLLECLRDRAKMQPLLLVLEDCHWIDPLSQALLEFLGRNIADLQVMMLVLYRPPTEASSPLQWGQVAGHVAEIRLRDLETTHAEELVRLKMQRLWGIGIEMPTNLIERVIARAQGNPFYLEEMLNFMRDRGVNPQDAQSLATIELPDSLHSLVISRIDQLAEAEKTTMKVASLIGRIFHADWLWGSYPQLGAPTAVKTQLQNLSRLDLTLLNKPEPELEYLFKHITTQEIAYESLAFATRATLHELIGQFIERHYAEALEQYVDVLALHYGRSHNQEKQRLYFRRAGDAAKAAYANQVAIDYYQRLLEILPEDERGEVLLALGEVLQIIGKWPEAEAMYQQALAQAVEQTSLRARCQMALGFLLSRTKSYAEALRWLEQALAGFEQLDDQQGIGQALERISFAHIQRGEYAQALTCAGRQLQIAMKQQNSEGICAAFYNMGVAHVHRRELEQGLVFLQQSLEAAAASHNQRGMLLAHNDIAGVYWRQDNHQQALAALLQGLEVARQIGHLQQIGLMIGNAGLLYGNRGAYTEALACYGENLKIILELGDRRSMLTMLGNIANVFTPHKYYIEAEYLYLRAVELARELSIPSAMCRNLYEIANLYSLMGKDNVAMPLNSEAQMVAAQLNRKDILFKSLLLSAALRVALNEIDTPSGIRELEALLPEWKAENEQAAIYYEIWRLRMSDEAARQKSAELYKALATRTPNIEYRQRYTELTGESLPEPEPLPPLPKDILGEPVDLRSLLEKAGVKLPEEGNLGEWMNVTRA